jgi:pyruvate ferredoxin oxidoreductase alpha subunit
MAIQLKAMSGNEAMAEAMRQINPDVVAAYPITPATEVVQIFAGFVHDGLVDTEFVAVESEHSAMSACIGAAVAGARAITSTSSQGLALMYEMLYIAAGLRLPIILAEVNRSLSGPLNIHCDHSDTMGASYTGWIQLFSENAQEAYDGMIQAVRIAEHPDVLLPAMVTTDGFIISHGMEAMYVLEDSAVKEFIGTYKPRHMLLDTDDPKTVSPALLQDSFFEFKRVEAEAMRKAKDVVVAVGKEFGKTFGRHYGLFESYCLEDAEVAIVVMGSTAGTAKVAIDELRAKGQKVGMLKLRCFRPFPYVEMAQALRHLKALGVMDRSDTFSSFGGPVFNEIRSALYDEPKKPIIQNTIYGLGGRDINTEDIKGLFERILRVAESGRSDSLVSYLGVRE